MKKMAIILSALFFLVGKTHAQDIQSLVTRIDQAATVKEFTQLAHEFGQLAEQQPNNWLAPGSIEAIAAG